MISLALVFHNHQPVGNFGWVIEELWEHAYAPMMAALERHPTIRAGLHYTGPLLEWLAANQPAAPGRIAALVRRGQVELLGGGWYEPILVALPDADRHAQLARMRDEVERLCGVKPRGAWLAERVWEPSLAHDLAAAGYEYTVLDDNHLRGAAVRDEDMWGTYVVDDRGRMLSVFGAEQGLRYLIPWRPVPEVIEHLRRHATPDGRRLGMMGDDGEKFGAWPDTYEYCWGKDGWVERFFSALEAESSWLTTVRPSDWLDQQPPLGRIAVPASSYVEMTEWALPPDEALVFHELLADARRRSDPAARFLRGGTWRAFQARYREINDLHKQMLRVSAGVEAMAPGALRERALDHLYRGQSNDCYWHGLFGGVYIVHMRMATLAELIAAEDLVAGESAVSGVGDHDLDGLDEALLGTPGQTVLVDVAEGAGIGSWDLRASRVALASVMRRRPEAYHQALRAMEAAETRGQKAAGKTATSIHDVLLAKESGLSAALVYDDHERRSGLVRLISVDGRQVGNFVNGPWKVEQQTSRQLTASRTDGSVTLRKTISLDGDRMDPDLSVSVSASAGSGGFEGLLEVEMNVNLSGGGGNPEAYYRVADGETRHSAAGSVPAGTDLAFGNRYEGVDVRAIADPPAETAWWPVETVSNSEAGFERMYQGSCLTFRWPLILPAGEEQHCEVRFAVTQTRDHRPEDGER